MAANYSANQYQSAFDSCNLQNWNVAKFCKQHPSSHDGYTQFIANDRGHLLPGLSRSKANPWGSFVGTWDMPRKIPPAKLNLTSRSAQASKRLTHWMEDTSPFIKACNGLRPSITGKVLDAELDTLRQRSCPKEKEDVHEPQRNPQHASPEPAPNRRGGSDIGHPGTSTSSNQKHMLERERAEICVDPVTDNMRDM